MSKCRQSKIFDAFQLPSKDHWDLRPFFEWAHLHNLTNFTVRPDTVEFAPDYSDRVAGVPEDWVVQHDHGVWLYSPKRFNEIYELVEEAPAPTITLGDLNTAETNIHLAAAARAALKT